MTLQSKLNNEALNKISLVKAEIQKAEKHEANQMTHLALREMTNSAKAVDNMNAEELEKFQSDLIESFKFRGYIA